MELLAGKVGILAETGGKNAFSCCHMTKDFYHPDYSWYGVVQRCATFGLTEINLGLKRRRSNFIWKRLDFETFEED